MGSGASFGSSGSIDSNNHSGNHSDSDTCDKDGKYCNDVKYGGYEGGKYDKYGGDDGKYESHGYHTKRQICDVNKFDCEDSDDEHRGERGDIPSGYKTPRNEEELDTDTVDDSFSSVLYAKTRGNMIGNMNGSSGSNLSGSSNNNSNNSSDTNNSDTDNGDTDFS